MTYYIGRLPEDILGDKPRYFYGLRRTDEGDLYFGKIDQLNNQESLNINNPGDPAEDFNDFEVGVDFFEGRDVYHNILYENLNYEQYRWDDRPIYYYINANGELIQSIGQAHTYPDPKDA